MYEFPVMLGVNRDYLIKQLLYVYCYFTLDVKRLKSNGNYVAYTNCFNKKIALYIYEFHVILV
jgi:hypothetical protein